MCAIPPGPLSKAWPTCILLLTSILYCPQRTWADDPAQVVDDAERSAHATALYLDCSAVPSWDHVTDIDRLKTSWNSTYSVVKRYLVEHGGERAGRALQIEAVLTHNLYSTQATAQQVVAVLQSSELIVSIDSGAAFSVDTTPPKLVVDTALIRYACDYLLPRETFDDLRQSAREISTANAAKMSATTKILHAESLRRANAFLIQSIRYEGLKLFVLAHEATHLSLDKFSPDLLKAKGYQGQTDCVSAMYTETRADIVGESAVRNIPIASISQEVHDHPGKYPDSLLASFSELATRAAYKDQLTIIQQTKEWLDYSSCQFSPQQRRDQLDAVFAREDLKKHIPN
jgi:hypothetical protein